MSWTMLRRALVTVILTMGMQALPAHAVSKSVNDASPQEIVDGMSNKAVRGLANAATGWLEFPKQIYQTSHEEGIARGIFIGPLKGIGMMLVRTVGGVGELATFFLAYPGFYDPYFDPEYPWQQE
jgi:putative exosortase-associated protein (TIGR04073 family)